MIHFMMSWHILRLKHCKGNAIMDKYCIEDMAHYPLENNKVMILSWE